MTVRCCVCGARTDIKAAFPNSKTKLLRDLAPEGYTCLMCNSAIETAGTYHEHAVSEELKVRLLRFEKCYDERCNSVLTIVRKKEERLKKRLEKKEQHRLALKEEYEKISADYAERLKAEFSVFPVDKWNDFAVIEDGTRADFSVAVTGDGIYVVNDTTEYLCYYFLDFKKYLKEILRYHYSDIKEDFTGREYLKRYGFEYDPFKFFDLNYYVRLFVKYGQKYDPEKFYPTDFYDEQISLFRDKIDNLHTLGIRCENIEYIKRSGNIDPDYEDDDEIELDDIYASINNGCGRYIIVRYKTDNGDSDEIRFDVKLYRTFVDLFPEKIQRNKRATAQDDEGEK